MIWPLNYRPLRVVGYFAALSRRPHYVLQLVRLSVRLSTVRQSRAYDLLDNGNSLRRNFKFVRDMKLDASKW